MSFFVLVGGTFLVYHDYLPPLSLHKDSRAGFPRCSTTRESGATRLPRIKKSPCCHSACVDVAEVHLAIEGQYNY